MFSYLKDKTAVAELFRDVSPKIAERPGGYTRILKIGNRIGDNADMCIMELVDFNEAMMGCEAAKVKTTRRRKSTKKKDDGVVETKAPKAVKVKAEKTTEKSADKVEEPTGESVIEA